jgi:hypothetical protein
MSKSNQPPNRVTSMNHTPVSTNRNVRRYILVCPIVVRPRNLQYTQPMTTTQQRFQQILNQHPNLCDNGYNYNYQRNCRLDNNAALAYFQQYRRSLEDSLDAVRKAIIWCDPIRRTRTSTSGGGYSYGLKHVMEHQTGIYVTNGVFIVAALMLEIPVGLRSCQRTDSPNPSIGLSRRSYTNHPNSAQGYGLDGSYNDMVRASDEIMARVIAEYHH